MSDSVFEELRNEFFDAFQIPEKYRQVDPELAMMLVELISFAENIKKY